MPADRRARGNKQLADEQPGVICRRHPDRHGTVLVDPFKIHAKRFVIDAAARVTFPPQHRGKLIQLAHRRADRRIFFPQGKDGRAVHPQKQRINLRIGGIGRNVDDAFLKRNRLQLGIHVILQKDRNRRPVFAGAQHAGVRRQLARKHRPNQIAAEKIAAARRRFTLERAAFRNQLRHVGHMHTEPITVILLLNGKGKIAANGQPLRDCEQRLAAQVGTAGRRYPTRLHLLRFGAGFRRKRLPKRRAAQRGDYTGTQRFGRTEILHRQDLHCGQRLILADLRVNLITFAAKDGSLRTHGHTVRHVAVGQDIAFSAGNAVAAADEVLRAGKHTGNTAAQRTLEKRTALSAVRGEQRQFLLGKTHYAVDYIPVEHTLQRAADHVHKPVLHRDAFLVQNAHAAGVVFLSHINAL